MGLHHKRISMAWWRRCKIDFVLGPLSLNDTFHCSRLEPRRGNEVSALWCVPRLFVHFCGTYAHQGEVECTWASSRMKDKQTSAWTDYIRCGFRRQALHRGYGVVAGGESHAMLYVSLGP